MREDTYWYFESICQYDLDQDSKLSCRLSQYTRHMSKAAWKHNVKQLFQV